MKFSYSLKYNAVPEWQDHYLNYSQLKKLIYTLQQQELTILKSKGDVDNEDESGSSGGGLKKFKTKFGRKGFKRSTDDVECNIETYELDDVSPNKEKTRKSKFIPTFDEKSSGFSDKSVFNFQETFLTKLTDEKVKVDDFYKKLEIRIFKEFETLVGDLENAGITRIKHLVHANYSEGQMEGESVPCDNGGLPFTKHQHTHNEDIDGSEDDGEPFADEILDNTALLQYSDVNIKSQKKSILKKKIIDLYIDMTQLKSFIELNRIGFLKIAKKFDKVLDCSIKHDLIESGEFFSDTYIFKAETLTRLDENIFEVIEYYAVITNQKNNIQTCKEELRSFLRDFIVWERNTVWKDMLGLESHKNDLTSMGRPDVNGDISIENNTHLDYYCYNLPSSLNFKLFEIEKLCVPKLFFTAKSLKIFIIIIITIILLAAPTFNDPAEHRCMALVTCVAFMWATEALPLFVTAILVPLLVVLFRVLKDPNGVILSASDSSSTILSAMWSSTIMVLLAGFTLAAGLSKYNIARVLASYLLSAAGTKPRNILLVVMVVVFFLSMWISNVAAPVLTYSLISSVLKSLDSHSPFAKALVLGVALSANIGGMASPISSPQNVISMTHLKQYNIGWGQFFAVALPVSVISVFLIWVLLLLTFKIHSTKLVPYKPIVERFTLKQYFVIIVAIGTILLWCVLSKIENVFGSAGQIAVIPIVLFFGTGLLTTQDINNYPWSIILLAMGGTALGRAVSSSGLLATISRALQERVMYYPAYAVLAIFGLVMLVVGTFVSHTVSAIIIIPLVQEIGNQLPDPKAAPILVFGCSLLASCGMGLASSGFPNVTAISMTDGVGNRYLTVNTFITRGVPASLLTYATVLTVGYGIMDTIFHGYVPT